MDQTTAQAENSFFKNYKSNGLRFYLCCIFHLKGPFWQFYLGHQLLEVTKKQKNSGEARQIHHSMSLNLSESALTSSFFSIYRFIARFQSKFSFLLILSLLLTNWIFCIHWNCDIILMIIYILLSGPLQSFKKNANNIMRSVNK